MDYTRKGSDYYKKEQAYRVFEKGEHGDCSKIMIARMVHSKERNVKSSERKNHPFKEAVGISVTGLQTNVAIPRFDVTLDAGANVEKVLERNLIVSHFDGDHVSGLGRAICNAINRRTKLDIYMPSMKDHPHLRKIVNKFMKKDKNALVKIHEMEDGDITSSGDRMIEAFKVLHSPESLGFSVWEPNKNGKMKRKMTFTGDVNLSGMKIGKDHPIKNTETLVVDASLSGGLLPIFEPLADLFTNHSSTPEIKEIAKEENNLKNIGLIHFPFPITCSSIEQDVRKRFGEEEEKVYYLKSCSEAIGDNATTKMTTFEKVTPDERMD